MSAHAARSLGAAVGYGLDRLVPEPSDRVHPVALFGRGMRRLEERMWRDSRPAGVAFAAVGIVPAVAAGVLLERVMRRTPATAVAATISIAAAMLRRVALGVGELLDEGDLGRARRALPSLVGRDPSELDGSEVARAVVESVAENTIDAAVAPVLWGAIGGAPAVLAHRAANTLDAMVGHRTPRYARFGWASARADDLLNWIPARMGAAGVALLRPRSVPAVLRTVRRDAARHPSPNGGVIEAAFAAALGIRLGGSNRYGGVVEDRGTLGDGRAPRSGDIRRAIRLADHLGVATALAALAVASASKRHRHFSPTVGA